MNTEQFYFLYVNCNSLAEFAFRQAAADILREIESQPPQAAVTLTPEELEARLETDFENMDLSALDGINFDFFSAPTETIAVGIDSPVPEPEPELESEPPVTWPAQQLDPGDGSAEELDLEIYMSRAYSHEEELRPRLERYYRRADLDALTALLAKLPAQLPALAQRLTADQMSEWLTLYCKHDEPLTALVVKIRQLDMGN